MDRQNVSYARQRYLGPQKYLEEIFARWKKVHLIALFIQFIASIVALCFNKVLEKKFSPYCYLYANVSIRRVEEVSDLSYIVVLKSEEQIAGSQWGSQFNCEFTAWILLLSLLMSVIWIVILTVKGDYSANLLRSLVPYTCIVGSVTTLLTFIAAFLMTRGGNILCESFEETELQNCQHAQSVKWGNLPLSGFYYYLRGSQVAMWISTDVWFYHSVMALLRWMTNSDYAMLKQFERKYGVEENHDTAHVNEESQTEDGIDEYGSYDYNAKND